jgi:hypothetical protein
LTEVLFTKICNKKDVYLSILESKKSISSVFFKRIYVFFTRFRSIKLRSDRYVISRYYLIRLAQNLGIYGEFNYCFSHSGKYSAVLVSSESALFSVDIEPVNRRLPESLRLKVRSLYPELISDELIVILILESLVKYSGFTPPVNLSKGLNEICSIQIIELSKHVFEVIVGDVKVYSEIHIFSGLYVCITLELNQFDLSL